MLQEQLILLFVGNMKPVKRLQGRKLMLGAPDYEMKVASGFDGSGEGRSLKLDILENRRHWCERLPADQQKK
jgi:hypothetical protein